MTAAIVLLIVATVLMLCSAFSTGLGELRASAGFLVAGFGVAGVAAVVEIAS